MFSIKVMALCSTFYMINSPIDDVAETVNDNNDADETLSSQVEFTEEVSLALLVDSFLILYDS